METESSAYRRRGRGDEDRGANRQRWRQLPAAPLLQPTNASTTSSSQRRCPPLSSWPRMSSFLSKPLSSAVFVAAARLARRDGSRVSRCAWCVLPAQGRLGGAASWILPEVGLVSGVTQHRGGRAQGEAPVDVARKWRRENSSTCCPARCSEDVMYLSARCHHALDVCLHDGATTPRQTQS
jgi:hypothetical protein